MVDKVQTETTCQRETWRDCEFSNTFPQCPLPLRQPPNRSKHRHSRGKRNNVGVGVGRKGNL